MNLVCPMCEEYKSNQIGYEVSDRNVCDDCFDIFISEQHEARAKFMQEFEREYIPNLLSQRQREADERMIDEMLREDYARFAELDEENN